MDQALARQLLPESSGWVHTCQDDNVGNIVVLVYIFKAKSLKICYYITVSYYELFCLFVTCNMKLRTLTISNWIIYDDTNDIKHFCYNVVIYVCKCLCSRIFKFLQYLFAFIKYSVQIEKI